MFSQLQGLDSELIADRRGGGQGTQPLLTTRGPLGRVHPLRIHYSELTHTDVVARRLALTYTHKTDQRGWRKQTRQPAHRPTSQQPAIIWWSIRGDFKNSGWAVTSWCHRHNKFDSLAKSWMKQWKHVQVCFFYMTLVTDLNAPVMHITLDRLVI